MKVTIIKGYESGEEFTELKLISCSESDCIEYLSDIGEFADLGVEISKRGARCKTLKTLNKILQPFNIRYEFTKE